MMNNYVENFVLAQSKQSRSMTCLHDDRSAWLVTCAPMTDDETTILLLSYRDMLIRSTKLKKILLKLVLSFSIKACVISF